MSEIYDQEKETLTQVYPQGNPSPDNFDNVISMADRRSVIYPYSDEDLTRLAADALGIDLYIEPDEPEPPYLTCIQGGAEDSESEIPNEPHEPVLRAIGNLMNRTILSGPEDMGAA